MINIDEYKEVLEALKSGFLDTADLEPYMQIIYNALEKQIPKKVIREFKSIGGAITCFETSVCPICEMDFYIDDLGQTMYCDFCPDCGQALDWSDEDEEDTDAV